MPTVTVVWPQLAPSLCMRNSQTAVPGIPLEIPVVIVLPLLLTYSNSLCFSLFQTWTLLKSPPVITIYVSYNPHSIRFREGRWLTWYIIFCSKGEPMTGWIHQTWCKSSVFFSLVTLPRTPPVLYLYCVLLHRQLCVVSRIIWRWIDADEPGIIPEPFLKICSLYLWLCCCWM